MRKHNQSAIRETRQIVRLSYKEMYKMFLLTFLFYIPILMLFLYEGWHVPVFWQPTVAVFLFILTLIIAMTIQWRIICIKVKNQ